MRENFFVAYRLTECWWPGTVDDGRAIVKNPVSHANRRRKFSQINNQRTMNLNWLIPMQDLLLMSQRCRPVVKQKSVAKTKNLFDEKFSFRAVSFASPSCEETFLRILSMFVEKQRHNRWSFRRVDLLCPLKILNSTFQQLLFSVTLKCLKIKTRAEKFLRCHFGIVFSSPSPFFAMGWNRREFLWKMMPQLEEKVSWITRTRKGIFPSSPSCLIPRSSRELCLRIFQGF